MIDYFSLALSHGLLLLCLIRIARDKTLDPAVLRSKRFPSASKRDAPAGAGTQLEADTEANDAA